MHPNQETVVELVIQKSKFIGILIPFNGNLKEQLEKIKMQYKKATHYCYAFSYQQEEGVHDDKEPAKTAGIPILQMIKKYKLENTLLVVVRYFGGIKLGVGGLIRAYQKTAEEVIQKATLIPFHEKYRIVVKLPYEKLDKLKYLLQDETILNLDFHEQVTVTALVRSEKKQELVKNFQVLSISKDFYE